MADDHQRFAAFCRGMAEKLRRLADEMIDSEHRAMLLIMADEFDAKAGE